MGLAEAKRYIKELRKRQENPYLWPDFLTGLPDKAAILKKLEEIFPKIGKYSIVYVRIANIHPYLIKYGPSNHANIIQWAAAILKTTAEECKNSFVGTISTHDFIAICETGKLESLFASASSLFRKKIKSFYNKEDLNGHETFSVRSGSDKVNFGLIKFIAVIANKKFPVSRGQLIQNMSRVCDEIEKSGKDMVVLSEDMIRVEK